MVYVSGRLAQFFPILAIDFVPKWSVFRTRKSAMSTVGSLGDLPREALSLTLSLAFHLLYGEQEAWDGASVLR
jgi:hypothetical protein